jgi:hypothetical protein
LDFRTIFENFTLGFCMHRINYRGVYARTVNHETCHTLYNVRFTSTVSDACYSTFFVSWCTVWYGVVHDVARYRVRKYLSSTVYCVWYSGVVLFVLECDVLNVLPGS